MIELVLTWENAYFVGLWFAAGILLTWSRPVGISIAVPTIVAALPVLFGLDPEGTGLVVLPFGSEILAYVEGIALPVTASVLGGHVAVAMNPNRQSRRQTRTILSQVRERAQRIEAEITQIESEIGRGSGEVLPHLEISQRRRELRELGGELDGSA